MSTSDIITWIDANPDVFVLPGLCFLVGMAVFALDREIKKAKRGGTYNAYRALMLIGVITLLIIVVIFYIILLTLHTWR